MTQDDVPFEAPHEQWDRIVVVRGRRVILDSDLARLYGVPTKRLNEKVRAAPGALPDHPPHRPFLSYVFTEGGAGKRHLALINLQNVTS
jgi:ORF6N domain